MFSKELKNRIITEAWKNNDFKDRLMKEPKMVLTEMGFSFPVKNRITVVEETADDFYFVLPSNPVATVSVGGIDSAIGMGNTCGGSPSCATY